VAKFVATDVKTTINGTDYSTSLAAVTLDLSSDEVETTAFGGGGYRSRVAGLKDASITLDFHQDFAAGSVDATLWNLFGSQATVVITPTSSAVSASNPSYTGVFLVSQTQPYASSVGDLATMSVTWPLASGTVARGTAA
jgi:predicted secreted protein